MLNFVDSAGTRGLLSAGREQQSRGEPTLEDARSVLAQFSAALKHWHEQKGIFEPLVLPLEGLEGWYGAVQPELFFMGEFSAEFLGTHSSLYLSSEERLSQLLSGVGKTD